MRLTAAARRTAPFRSDAQSDSVPASVGGWDTISALSLMKPDHAIQMDNFIPHPGWLEPRRGYTAWGTSLGTASSKIETLMTYNGVTANKLFAVASNGTFYDVTAQGAGIAQSVTGMTNARWQFVNWTNSANTKYLIAANGADVPKIYDGAAWADLNVTGLTIDTGPEIEGKKLQLLKEAAPNITRVALVLTMAQSETGIILSEVTRVAQTLGVTIEPVRLPDVAELPAAFEAITAARAQAVALDSSTLGLTHRRQILDFTSKQRLPGIYAFRAFPESGGLMSYGVDTKDLAQRTGGYVARMVKSDSCWII